MILKGKILASSGASLVLACFLAFGMAYQQRVAEGGMVRTEPTTGVMTAVTGTTSSVPATSDLDIPAVPTVPGTDSDVTEDDFDSIDIGGYGSAGKDTEDIPVSGTGDVPETMPAVTPDISVTTPAPETAPVPETTPAHETTPAPVTTSAAPITTSAPVITVPEGQGGLYDIENPDPDYGRRVVVVTGEDRALLEALVEGEAGDQGFIGAAMVAQCIKDAMTYEGYETVAEVRLKLKYTGRIDRKPCEDVVRAVAYIFDEGGYAVKHPMLYFYYSRNGINVDGFHETQELVVEYKDHRYFWKKP